MQPKKDLTAAQRKAAERKRLRERGLVPVEVWVLPEHKDALKAYVVSLQARDNPFFGGLITRKKLKD